MAEIIYNGCNLIFILNKDLEGCAPFELQFKLKTIVSTAPVGKQNSTLLYQLDKENTLF